MNPSLHCPTTQGARAIDARLSQYDWSQLEQELDAQGYARVEALLDPEQCDALVALYAEEQAFRNRVVMARHGYGRGEYKYLAYPLPSLVASLRTGLYARLVPIANRWNSAMGLD